MMMNLTVLCLLDTEAVNMIYDLKNIVQSNDAKITLRKLIKKGELISIKIIEDELREDT